MTQVLTSWLRRLRGEHLLRSREKARRTEGIEEPDVFVLGALAVGSLLLAGLIYVETRPRNLLAPCFFRTSSVSDEFDFGAHTWHGTAIPVFFMTRDEPQPWIEYDLGRSTRLRRVVVSNRPDCCRDRAVPLVLELSDDRQQWREIGRVTQDFFSWDTRFPVETGRYLRLRVSRASILHLACVEAFER